MGTQALVNLDIERGKTVLKALDDAGLDVRAAFWYYVAEASEWRLALAMPVVDREGPRAGYEAVQKVLAKQGKDEAIPLHQIWVVGVAEALPRLLRGVVKTGRNATGDFRVTNSVVNGVLIEDAYIYRSAA